jgi:uncharacterized protein YcgL (UPF0745 family)
VRKEGDFAGVPAPLLQSFGTAEFVMRLDLSPERKLARSDVEEVMRNLAGQGFHLQMPPTDPTVNPTAPASRAFHFVERGAR